MKLRTLLATLVALLALGITPAYTTDSHDYAKDEYAIIRDGVAPNKQMSLASHADGKGDGGSTNFRVWLMAEPAHRKLARLGGIGPDGILDTGPNAYYAFWSADSRHVAVTYRSDRHVVEFNLYAVEGRRARLMSGPSLFRDVTSREAGRDDDMRRSVPEFEWKGTRRFLLKDNRLFLTSDPAFARMLGRYGRIRTSATTARCSSNSRPRPTASSCPAAALGSSISGSENSATAKTGKRLVAAAERFLQRSGR